MSNKPNNTCPNCGTSDVFSPYDLDTQTPVFECGECEAMWTDNTRDEVGFRGDAAQPANYQTELNDPLG